MRMHRGHAASQSRDRSKDRCAQRPRLCNAPLREWCALRCVRGTAASRVACTRDPDGDGNSAMHYLLVFVGGGVGSTLRHIINLLSSRVLGTAFPYHTFIINITGS